MSDVIIESGMPFSSENAFHIEKSPIYTHIKSSGIKSVEFIRVLGDELMFVEAKPSFANPYNPAEGNYSKFQAEVDEICEKFIHSLNMYASVKVGAAGESFPDDFVPAERMTLVFVLVIKNHECKWCKPIYSKLVETLPTYLMKIWKPKVYVINHEAARKKNLTIV